MKLDDRRHLERLQHDFEQASPFLHGMVLRVLDEGITRHPVLVASRNNLDLGVLVLPAEQMGLYWHFRLSPLEELVKKALVSPEQLPDFRARHAHPRNKACILLVPPATFDARFVFIPFDSEHAA